MSNHNEDSQETHYSSTFARHTAGQLSRDEERAITEHQVRGRHWTADETRRSTRTSGSRGATPVHRVMHDSENESQDSYASGKSSQELDGPQRSQREASDSSEFSLPPPPSETRSNQSGGSNISPSIRSPINRPTGATNISPSLRSPENRPPGATNISPSLRSPPKRPPGAGNVFPLPPDVAAIEALVLLQASGQLGDSHIKGFVSRPSEDGSNSLGYAETHQMQILSSMRFYLHT